MQIYCIYPYTDGVINSFDITFYTDIWKYLLWDSIRVIALPLNDLSFWVTHQPLLTHAYFESYRIFHTAYKLYML